MEPISIFLNVIDRIIQLLKHQKIKREEFFGQIIKPLYESLPLAVEDMLNFLLETEKIIRNGEYDSDTIFQLRQQRQKYLTSRIQIQSTAKEITKQIDDEEYKIFSDQVAELFSATEPNILEDNSYLKFSVSGMIIDILKQEITHQARTKWNNRKPAHQGSRFVSINKPGFDESMLLSIELSRNRLELRWKNVSKSYAALLHNRYS